MIVASVVAVGTVGFVVAAVLALATRLTPRQSTHLVQRVYRLLPKVDCRACGHATCEAFAKSVVAGNAGPRGCIPGGPRTAHRIAEALGTTTNEGWCHQIAVVHCAAERGQAVERAVYDGIADCRAAMLCGNGARVCQDACLGLGTCVRACRFDALAITAGGVSKVSQERCTGCGACVSACPRGVIELIPAIHKVFVGCNNHDKGPGVTNYCSRGCTACSLCVEATPSGAIEISNNLPRLDYTANENFLPAVHKCPSSCFVDLAPARPKVNIDTKCDGCTACVAVCPVTAIAGATGSRHVVDKNKCIGCGICIGMCHVHAIGLLGGLGFNAGEVKSGWQRRFR